MTLNITLTSGSTNVTIAVTSVEELLMNKLETETPPQSTSNKTNGPKDTIIVSLQRIERRWTIDGYLSNDINNASTDKTNLLNIYINGSSVSMDYTSPSTSGIIEKLQITEVPTDSASAAASAPQTYQVKLTFLKGTLFPSTS